MPDDFNAARLTEETLIEFCREFVRHPYLCYTEHGLHALFFARLYAAFETEDHRYGWFDRHKVCVIQKEYPTHAKLIRNRRQNWDISVIEKPVVVPEGKNPYDHLKLAVVVEFGLNYGKEHVRGDIQRLAHADSNVGLRLAANLYRFTTAADRFCGRDWSPKARSICNRADLLGMLQEHPGVVVYYGGAGGAETGVWRLRGYPES